MAYYPYDEDLVNVFYHIYQNHSKTWVSGNNLCVSVFSGRPPYDAADMRCPEQDLPESVDIDDLLWSNKPLKKFFTSHQKHAPCLSVGDEKYWRSVHNHNQSCERNIGWLRHAFVDGRIRDFKDGFDMKKVDEKMRGFVLNHKKSNA